MGPALETIKPEPDSQYRLRPCSCGSTEVVYAKYIHPPGGEMWRVVCTACGVVLDLQSSARHEVQVEWNRRNSHG